ncbi:cyclic AMP-dependent transcription factor ATF-4 [Notolabrus celidotus]|uniref:cyclic AMP-dependent transcription factor ATF-4 n=1 Tax=Notolabrus celidotus TaxID=1203425 RepID=UPI0014904B19|nr:cyclic AMP-dependent transcription factor ATF-4 [Notolabrus celidotus]
MTLSQLALEDVEALCLGPSFLMADPMGPLLDQDEEEALSPSSSLEGKAPASPPLSFSSYASSLSPYQTLSSPLSSASPPASPLPFTLSHSSFPGTKAGVDSLSLPWLGASDLLDAHIGADDVKDDSFAGMDWMSEKIDLSEFDLESLIGSCSSDESPSSPEDLLASLDSHMDLDLESFNTTTNSDSNNLGLELSLPSTPALPLELPLPEAAEASKMELFPEQEVVMKSEPPSPVPSPPPPSSPVCTLELGSEVDVLDAEKTATSITATIIPDPSGSIQTSSPIVLSLPTTGHIVVVLTNEEEPTLLALPDQSIKTSPPSSDCDSDSGIESGDGSPSRLPSPPPTPSPSAGSSRTKPYTKPEPNATPSPSAKVKSVSGAPKVVEKKLKKMEQNKTAATRYRQKKRSEQELLGSEMDDLEKRNHELKEKAESISREIQYLKDLMEEVRKHRRGKTSSAAQ